MRPHLLVAVAVSLASASPAAAQLSNRSISLESGLAVPLGEGGAAAVPVALAATTWLEGPLDAVARLSFGVAGEPSGRAAAHRLEGTAGLRWSFGSDAVRPHVQLELGWARSAAPDGAGADGLVAAAGAGLEWFARRDVALCARASARHLAAEPARLELLLAAARYF